MDDFFPEIDIREDQAEAIARGLYAVAKADGKIHEREAAMISEFFTTAADHPSSLGALARTPQISPQDLATVLSTAELRQLFAKTALLLAYVDGVYTSDEQKLIASYAKALGITDVAGLEAQVKDYLIAHLAHLQNVHGVAEIAKKL